MTPLSGGLTWQGLLMLAIELVCLVTAVVLHEAAHGYAAWRLGDPTAKRAGRLSLNPARHIDPFGSVILPLCCLALGGFVLAYAKPVPYNPAYFRDRRRGELVVAFAGPLANLAQALAGAALCLAARAAAGALSPGGAGAQAVGWVFAFGSFFCLVNLVLFFFNIIPLPPLDGASVAAVFLDERGMRAFHRVKQHSMLILLALLVLVPAATPWDPVGWYMRHTAYALYGALV